MKSFMGKGKARVVKLTASQRAARMRRDGTKRSTSPTSTDPLWSKFEILLATMFGSLSEQGGNKAKSVKDDSLRSFEDALSEEAIANIPHLFVIYRRLNALVRVLADDNVPCNQLALHHLIKQTELNIERVHRLKPHRVAAFAGDMFRFPVLASNPPDNVALSEWLCRVEAGSFVSEQDLQSRRKRDVCADIAWHYLLSYKTTHESLDRVSQNDWPSLRKRIGATIRLEVHRHQDWYKGLAETIPITGQNRTTGRIESKMKERILNRIHAMLGLGTTEVT